MDFTYLWTTTDGNIIGGETTLAPEIDGAGTYLLTVLNNTNNCQTIASVLIGDATKAPDVIVQNTVELTCADPLTALSANSSTTNPSYVWTTANGNIVSGEMTPIPIIDAAGNYELTVTNQATGCETTATVIATENTTPPVINLDFPQELNCLVDFISLNGNGSAMGPNINYLWTTINGNIFGVDTLITAIVDEPGIYTFSIIDASNGCTSSTDLIVVQDITAPIVVATAPNQLGCGLSEVTLDGTGTSIGMDFTYLWTTQNGNIVLGETTLSAHSGCSRRLCFTSDQFG